MAHSKPPPLKLHLEARQAAEASAEASAAAQAAVVATATPRLQSRSSDCWRTHVLHTRTPEHPCQSPADSRPLQSHRSPGMHH